MQNETTHTYTTYYGFICENELWAWEKHANYLMGVLFVKCHEISIMDDRILYLNDDRKFLNASFDCKYLQSEFSTYLIMVVVKCSINARSFQWATFIYILLKHFYGKKIAKITVSYQQIFNALDSTSWYFRS